MIFRSRNRSSRSRSGLDVDVIMVVGAVDDIGCSGILLGGVAYLTLLGDGTLNSFDVHKQY